MLVLLACGHPAPPASPPPHPIARAIDAAPPPPADAPLPLDQDMPRLAERAVALYQAWAHALDTDDCAKATANMTAVAEQFADVIAANAKISKAGHEQHKALKDALASHDAEMEPAAKAIVAGAARCHDNADFVRAFDRIGGSPP